MTELTAAFGGIDIYLFDQLLRGRLRPGMRVFEAGCGAGRNLVYPLSHGYDVAGVDADPGAIAQLRELAARLAPALPASNFRAESIEEATFADGSAEFVISCALLHFARDELQFEAMLRASWRILAVGGVFFSRLASTIGMEDRHRPLGGRRFSLPDSSERFLVDERYLVEWTDRLGGELLDPLKTTVVQNQRCMTTWVVGKSA